MFLTVEKDSLGHVYNNPDTFENGRFISKGFSYTKYWKALVILLSHLEIVKQAH